LSFKTEKKRIPDLLFAYQKIINLEVQTTNQKLIPYKRIGVKMSYSMRIHKNSRRSKMIASTMTLRKRRRNEKID
jgi:hypothetical protein